MNNFTANTYEMKREIVKFSKKICKGSKKPILKFVTDMVYGILTSQSYLLTDISGNLHRTAHKANTIKYL